LPLGEKIADYEIKKCTQNGGAVNALHFFDYIDTGTSKILLNTLKLDIQKLETIAGAIVSGFNKFGKIDAGILRQLPITNAKITDSAVGDIIIKLNRVKASAKL
jgi:hypothetical protein